MAAADRVRGWLAGFVANPGVHRFALLVVDAAIAAVCFQAAMLLRFEGHISEPYLQTLYPLTLTFAGCRVLANLLLGIHRWSFRYSGLSDGARIGIAGLSGTGLLLGILYLVQVPGTPRSVVVLEMLLSTSFMAGIRFLPRLAGLYAKDWVRTRRKEAVRTLIVGAGSAGEMLMRDLQRSGGHNYQVVGFVDDDRSKQGMILCGRRVLGAIGELPALARSLDVEQVLIAIARLEGRRVREILTLCADTKLRFKILPVSFAYFQDRPASAVMEDLVPEDLLMRDQVHFEADPARVSLESRTALVTGAAGSIGSEICRQLLRAGLRRLVMVDLNENGLYLLSRRLQREFPPTEIFVEVADIRDPGRIESLFELHGPHDVFHAAAHKHVPLMESAPCEAVKNNIVGTQNVARAADVFKAERFVYVSTDKAVRPTSVMGASKRVGEELVRLLARRSRTRFCAVRFGNVLGSAGSVVPLFQEQIRAGGPVSVTHPDVRRYFMTVSEAVALVLRAAYGDHSELYVLDMGEQIRIADLARQMITMMGFVPDVDIPIEYTGLRPGEKLSEELMTEDEERTHRVNLKIFATECPSPSEDLEEAVGHLAAAAESEDPVRVVQVLERLVPSYRPAPVWIERNSPGRLLRAVNED